MRVEEPGRRVDNELDLRVGAEVEVHPCEVRTPWRDLDTCSWYVPGDRPTAPDRYVLIAALIYANPIPKEHLSSQLPSG